MQQPNDENIQTNSIKTISSTPSERISIAEYTKNQETNIKTLCKEAKKKSKTQEVETTPSTPLRMASDIADFRARKKLFDNSTSESEKQNPSTQITGLALSTPSGKTSSTEYAKDKATNIKTLHKEAKKKPQAQKTEKAADSEHSQTRKKLFDNATSESEKQNPSTQITESASNAALQEIINSTQNIRI